MTHWQGKARAVVASWSGFSPGEKTLPSEDRQIAIVAKALRDAESAAYEAAAKMIHELAHAHNHTDDDYASGWRAFASEAEIKVRALAKAGPQ